MRSLLLLLLLALAIPASAQTDSLYQDSAMRAWFADIDLPLDSCSNPALYAEVCNWTDVPYKYAHCSKKGTDCSGLSKAIYRSIYNVRLRGGSRDIYRQCVPVTAADLEEGDLVFFKIYNNNISHIGVYLGQHKFVHASTKRGVIVSDLREPYYRDRFFSGGRILVPDERASQTPVPTPTEEPAPTGYAPPAEE